MLEYTLEPNELTNDPNDFRAQVVNVQSFSRDEVIERILKIGAGLTRSDIVSVMEAEKQVVMDIITGGGGVNMDLYSAYPSIQGVFTATQEPDAHTVRINLHPSTVLRGAMAAVRTKRVPGGQGNNAIYAVIDAASGAVNSSLSVGGIVTITGNKVKVVGDSPLVGLYFKSLADETEIPYQGAFGENMPKRLTLVTPALTPGLYRIIIKTQHAGSGIDLKTPRILESPTDLLVSA